MNLVVWMIRPVYSRRELDKFRLSGIVVVAVVDWRSVLLELVPMNARNKKMSIDHSRLDIILVDILGILTILGCVG